MTWLYWAIPLIIIIFLWSLNEVLRGKLKEITAGILSLLIFGLCVVAFFVSGWFISLSALIGSFILANLFHYPAVAIARSLIRYPDLGVNTYQQKQFERTIEDFGSPDYYLRREKEKQEEAIHMEKCVYSALKLKQIRDVLEKHSGSEEDLAAFYQRVEITSLPPYMREMTMRNADMLDYFLQNSSSGEFNGLYVRNVTDVETSMTLTLWAKHNPNSAKP